MEYEQTMSPWEVAACRAAWFIQSIYQRRTSRNVTLTRSYGSAKRFAPTVGAPSPVPASAPRAWPTAPVDAVLLAPGFSQCGGNRGMSACGMNQQRNAGRGVRSQLSSGAAPHAGTGPSPELGSGMNPSVGTSPELGSGMNPGVGASPELGSGMNPGVGTSPELGSVVNLGRGMNPGPGVLVQKIKVRTILGKTNLPVGDYAVNPYVGCAHACQYCYASFMKRFTGHVEHWGSFVDIKEWEALRHPEKYAGKELFIGTVTDPYQPVEAQYGRTRAILEELKGSGCKISIITKSDLILRDLDLIKSFPEVRVAWSINTLDEGFQRDMDQAVSIERRLAAMKTFYEAGVRTTCFISPIFPGITQVEAIIKHAYRQCNLIWLENLNLRGSYKAVIMDYISKRQPQLLALYQDIYYHKDRSYWYKLHQEVAALTQELGLRYVRNDDSIKQPFNAPPLVVNYFFHEEIIPSARAHIAKPDALAQPRAAGEEHSTAGQEPHTAAEESRTKTKARRTKASSPTYHQAKSADPVLLSELDNLLP